MGITVYWLTVYYLLIDIIDLIKFKWRVKCVETYSVREISFENVFNRKNFPPETDIPGGRDKKYYKLR